MRDSPLNLPLPLRQLLAASLADDELIKLQKTFQILAVSNSSSPSLPVAHITGKRKTPCSCSFLILQKIKTTRLS